MKKISALVVLMLFLIGMVLTGCEIQPTQAPESSSGISKKTVKVSTDAGGWTIEQKNIKDRLTLDNKPGSIKHLYVISAYSGQVIIYSTVIGKVTSSGKRLSPYSVAAVDGQYVGSSHMGIRIDIAGRPHYTPEVLQDDGTYGHSIPYLFWWDVNKIYHQHYIQGGQIVHVSDQPIAVKDIIINMATVSS